ncbi:MAG: hypothetical protein ACI4MJ_02970 [Aristaeellaceae bacterium]
MEKNKTKTKKPLKPSDIKLEYLKGSPVDGRTLRSALSFMGSFVMLAIAFLLLGMAMMMDNAVLRVLFNGCLLAAALLMFYQTGAGQGAVAVNLGEMLFDRKKSGGTVTEKEQKKCYHPLKGLLIALIGSLPVVIAAIVLASVAQRQMTALGALPSWLSVFEGRTEIGNAVAYYHQSAALTVEDILRVIIRLLMMPLVNIVNPYGMDALLTLERLSPLVMLTPALSYGLGYMQGVQVRKRVHIGIAEGEVKRKKKEKRQRKAQQRHVPKGPEQLN